MKQTSLIENSPVRTASASYYFKNNLFYSIWALCLSACHQILYNLARRLKQFLNVKWEFRVASWILSDLEARIGWQRSHYSFLHSSRSQCQEATGFFDDLTVASWYWLLGKVASWPSTFFFFIYTNEFKKKTLITHTCHS